jgi:hypothetical protein
MITVTFKRRAGKTEMLLDCSAFHEYLRQCGVTESGGMFQHRPACAHVIDTSSHKIGSDLLLTSRSSPLVVALGDHYDRPVTRDVFRRLGESVQAAAEAIVDHYRPIDVIVKILPKALPQAQGSEPGPITES